MTARLLLLILLGISCFAHGDAWQGCPYPSSIKYVDGYFYQESAGHRWTSPRVSPVDFIDKFVGAVFMPGEGQERRRGYLEKCIYRSGREQRLVVLRYAGATEGLSMSLSDTTYWRLARDSFGHELYLCDDRQPDNCSFTLDALRY
ncbi:DUF3757 domain-containing protein [Pseudomonas mucidolens]|uniref:DUF3757 domain-containing protein n=1 Tax=Pseudomonas mucidolens TaxID=46679 RepID=UPI0030D821E9